VSAIALGGKPSRHYDACVTWSEDRIHRWLLSLETPRGLRGSRGHDAAVLAGLRGRPVVCVDQTLEGVHFVAGTKPRLVGRKAAARALSDLAATAARPRAILLALCAPPGRSSKWIQEVLAGARSMARECGADLVGGDLACARGPAGITVAALGDFAGRARPPGRDRAQAGQIVVLTGPVGGSLLGRHLCIRPRLVEGECLYARGATAMMDVSDGLAWDLHRLARLAEVRIDLDLSRVPVHADAEILARRSGRDPVWHALHDGEDHELIATLARSRLGAARRCCPGLAVIGRVSAGSGLWVGRSSGQTRRWKPSEGGWKHGG
jgi:thiamine-monophosphate kinase